MTVTLPSNTLPPNTAPRLLSDLVDRAAERFGDRTAVVSGERSIGFTDLATATRVVAAELRRLGVARGDRVVVVIDDFLTAIPWMLGVARRGGIYVLMNADTTRYAAEHTIADSGARLALSSGSSESRRCAEALGLTVVDIPVAGVTGPITEPAGPAPSPLDVPVSSDLVSILYTSGSTGRPKGVTGTHANMVFAAEAIAARLRLREDDVIGCVLPLAFDYGVYQVLLTLLTGARLVWGAGAAAGPGLLSFLVDNAVTVLPVVPGLAQNLDRLTRRATRSGAPLPPLRVLTNTGAAMSADLRLRLQGAYPELGVYLMFGLTECKRVSMLLPEELAAKPDSVGRPLDDTECVIIDGSGRVLPPGEVGELVVRGPHVTAGYWNDPERTALRFRPWGPMGERALFTGDQCRLDADGYLYFEGRDDDIYKANGFRVSATEVAIAAEEIPGVDEAFCAPARGEEPALLAVVADVDAHRVREELQKLLEWFKVPDDIVVVDRLPLNRNGKVDAVAVRALRPVAGAVGRRAARAMQDVRS
ncbi:MAG TPA: AMP-binding protein [Pseudonocardia sp.]|nr:AMP-binding protein [Pseudonocardia sp.]